MNSRRAGVKGKSTTESGSGNGDEQLNELTSQIAGTNLGSQEGGWETIGKKSKKPMPAAGKHRGQGGSSSAAPKACVHPEGALQPSWPSGNNWDRRPVGRGNPRPPPQTKAWETEYQGPRPVIPPPLAHGWQWASRPPLSSSEAKKEEVPSADNNPELENAGPDDVSDDDHDNLDDDSDDELSDNYDSDECPKSFDSRKQNRWFKGFFEALDKLTPDEISEQTRQWHCPACKNGPGAIDWYKGLQPLMTHARTKGSTRVKIHRELAALLEEELSRRGTSVIPAGEQFGKWKGLRETNADHEIVWPPMVIVMNTQLQQDDNDKWTGMGNQELVDYFRDYTPSKARHSYGPRGHRGISVLIFESSAMGYMAAERLHKHFVHQGTDREAWDSHPVLFLPGGKRQLYGFMARKEDMETFNLHCQGKSRLKYETKSYHEMVVIPMKQMNEDNQQLNYLKNKVVKTQQHSKQVEETLEVVTQKLRETMEDNRIVKLRTQTQYDEHKKEMDFQEKFFQDQIEKVHQATEEKELMFEKLLQQERAKAQQSDLDSGTSEDRKLRKEKIERFIDGQVKGVEEFEAARDEMIKVHEEKQLELKKEYLAREVQLEQEFDASLTALMEKFKPGSFDSSSSSLGSGNN